MFPCFTDRFLCSPSWVEIHQVCQKAENDPKLLTLLPLPSSFAFLSFSKFLFYIYGSYVHLYTTYMSGACGGKKKASSPQELKLQMVNELSNGC